MSTIRDAIDTIDPTMDKAKEAKELLQLLNELASEKSNLYQTSIAQSLRTAGTPENKTVPISAELLSQNDIRVITSSTPNDDITKAISEGLKSILVGTKDGIIDGIIKLVDTGINTVLGCAEGQEREGTFYGITTDGMSIVRLDMMYWSRNITASGLTKYAEKSVVCATKKSSVDLGKVDFNTFLSVYRDQLAKFKMSEDDIMEEIKHAKKIYKLLTDKEDLLSSNAMIDIAPAGTISTVCNKVSTVWPSR